MNTNRCTFRQSKHGSHSTRRHYPQHNHGTQSLGKRRKSRNSQRGSPSSRRWCKMCHLGTSALAGNRSMSTMGTRQRSRTRTIESYCCSTRSRSGTSCSQSNCKKDTNRNSRRRSPSSSCTAGVDHSQQRGQRPERVRGGEGDCRGKTGRRSWFGPRCSEAARRTRHAARYRAAAIEPSMWLVVRARVVLLRPEQCEQRSARRLGLGATRERCC